MWQALDVSTSGLVAQRTRLNVIANNIANISTTHNEQGERVPFQARFVTFEAKQKGDELAGSGVQVAGVGMESAEPLMKYQPGHPDARPDGYVAYPNINLMEQMVDSMEASRAYEANLSVIEVTKAMAQQTLSIIA